MASRSVHVADFGAALADGTIPGEFTTAGEGLGEIPPGAHVFAFPQLESLSSRGARLFWQIFVMAEDAGGKIVPIDKEWLRPGAKTPPGVRGVIRTVSFQVSAKGVTGKVREGGVPTVVAQGKNEGKVNETNPVTQALRDALGRYNHRVKRERPAAPDAAAETPEDTTTTPGDETAAPGEGKKEETAAPEDTTTAPGRALRPPPMLVKRLGETRDATLTAEKFEQGITAQRKFDGVRVVAFYDAGSAGENGGKDEDTGRVILYSRTEGIYPGLTNIRKELEGALKKAPKVPDELIQPPQACDDKPYDPAELAAARRAYAESAVHLDGESYKHGKSLEWISGQARREDDDEILDYVVFDCFFPEAKAAGYDMASENRQKYLDLLFRENPALRHIMRAENFPVKTMKELEDLRDRFLAEGYEGAIARKNCAGYQYSFNNYHSANLVKIKPLYDSEFEVVGYTQGKKGKAVGAVIWICEVDPAHVKNPADKTFDVVPKNMTEEQRKQIFACLGQDVGGGKTRFERDFKGKPLTVEYPDRSAKTGKPTKAKALTFRTYENGLANDPLKKLYEECAVAPQK